MTVMTVCSGNICRSPMAMAILRYLRPSLKVFSRGLVAGKGCPMSSGAEIALRRAGIPVPNHRSAPLKADDVRRAHYILCSTAEHRDAILAKYSFAFGKTYTIKPDGEPVEDPYPLTPDVYAKCRDELIEALRIWMRLIERPS